MSDVAVRTAHRPHSESMPIAAGWPQLCQLRVLFWKEWREQRLVLLGLLTIVSMIIGLAGIRYRLSELERHWLTQSAIFCYIITGWVLGAAVAGGEHVTGTGSFLHASPVPLWMVWLVKLIVGLVSTLAAVGATVIFTWYVADLHTALAGADLEILACVALFCFAMSHYCGCWVRSTILAMALGLALGALVLVLSVLNPISLYLSDYGQEQSSVVLVLLLVVGLAVLGRGRFIAAMQARPSRRRCVAWFLLPVALFGALPLAAGTAVLALDVLRLDPTDLASVESLTVRLQRDRVVACAKYWRPGPWLKWRQESAGISVCLGDGRARHMFSSSSVRWIGGWSPGSRSLMATLRERPRQGRFRSGGYRLATVDAEQGTLDTLPDVVCGGRLKWLSEHELLFTFDEINVNAKWGIWNAQEKTLRAFEFPEDLKREPVRCVGFLSKPDRIAFSNAIYRPAVPAIFMLDVETHRVERLELPSKHHLCFPMLCSDRVLLRTWPSEKPGEAVVLPPQLLDLASGEGTSVEALLGETPSAGWHAMNSWTSGGRWLFVTPHKWMAEPPMDWYAVDITSGSAFRHRPPFPRRAQFSPSGRVAFSLPYSPGSALCVYSLHQTDLTKRTVLVSECANGKTRVNCFAWLGESKLVLGVSAQPPRPVRGRRLLKSLGWSGIFVADMESKRVRPVWVGKGIDVRWRFMTWSEWKQNAPTN